MRRPTARNAAARALVAQDPTTTPRRALEAAGAVLVALERWERADRVIRLQLGRQAKLASGYWHAGTPPYGFRSSGYGRLTEVPHERVVVEWICRQREQGWSWRSMVERLNTAGTPGPRGGPWNPSTVRRIAARGTGVPAGATLEG